jgi:hypothetical protein
VRCHARVLLPAETATALVPGYAAIRQHEPPDEPRLASWAAAAVQVYDLDGHDETHGFFFALTQQGWSSDPWSSDARVLYCHIEKDKLVHLVMIGGTFVSWRGRPLLKAAVRSAFFEWRKRDTALSTGLSEFSVAPLFEELTGETLISNRGSSPYAEKH